MKNEMEKQTLGQERIVLTISPCCHESLAAGHVLQDVGRVKDWLAMVVCEAGTRPEDSAQVFLALRAHNTGRA